jgi:hypothetical protein
LEEIVHERGGGHAHGHAAESAQPDSIVEHHHRPLKGGRATTSELH